MAGNLDLVIFNANCDLFGFASKFIGVAYKYVAVGVFVVSGA
jgi:hypothetical protein